jgi:hypothetical protein
MAKRFQTVSNYSRRPVCTRAASLNGALVASTTYLASG